VVSTFGACSVFYVTGTATSPTDPVLPTYLDAGTALTVTGPGGAKTLTSMSTGLYSATLGSSTTPPLYLNPGTYTITGPGGKDVGAINTSITLPPTLTWTNASSISTVNRANGQLITWTGGDPAGTTEIAGFSATTSGSSTVAAGFECTAPTSAGQFTIPSVVLLSLPPTPAGGITAGSFGLLEVGAAAAPKSFTATGLDLGYITAVTTAAQTVTFQ
jgi:hypothetical protein